MTKNERRAVLSLATILALRMLGLFMVLPVFSLYAAHLTGSTPFLIGLAVGIYGLTQALFQIPFGALSDYMGRRKIIAFGLLLFGLGSIISAMSHSIVSMILGRALQGTGAVGSTIMAMIADLTSEKQRTKAMAIIGMTIGASFSFAMLLGPLFAAWIQVDGIFWLAGFLSVLAILILFTLVPIPIIDPRLPHPAEKAELAITFLLKHSELMRLNAGIFILHAIFTATFVILPISLFHAGLAAKQQWWLYLPALLLAFVCTLPMIIYAEKKQCVREFFLGAIGLLGSAELLFWFFAHSLLLSAGSLLLFFTSFSLLEAFLPSLVSRSAPPQRKGLALGIYSCAQFLGIFVGGATGGWLYGACGLTSVYLFCAILAALWGALAFRMKKYHH